MFIYVTDGTLTSKNQLRKFRLICEHGNYAWVECSDGSMKTYPKSSIKRVTS